MYTIEFKPRIPVGISHLRNCTRFPSCLNCSHLSKGKILTRDAKSIHCIQCYALWSLAEILKPCVFFTRPKADHCLPLSLTHSLSSKLLDVVSVADVDAEECVEDNLVKILKLRFGRFWN